MDPTSPIDTTNLYLVGRVGDKIRVSRNTQLPMTRAEALNLAAWLVTLADPEGKQFPAVLKAIGDQ